MITQTNNVALNNSYQNQEAKTSKNSVSTITKQGDISKIDALKASIENGEYQVDIKALAQKIAEEIL